jgi:ribonuclease D
MLAYQLAVSSRHIESEDQPLTQRPAKVPAVFVETRSRLADSLAAIERASVVGLDTEFVGDATYEPRLCLVQVATGDSIFLVDPLARLDLRDLWLTLTAPGRELVAFAARQELLFCLRYAGRLPDAVFDPQIAAGLVGFGYPLSHSNFVRRLFGGRPGGSEAYTDWGRRPLAAQQLEYAADDVRHLLAGRERLLERARDMGRLDWLHSEFHDLLETVRRADSEERWWKTPGISRMDGRVLAVVRELWRWRDAQARASDLPPRRVLSDDLLLEIARRAPRNVGSLLALRGMDRPALRKAAPEIVRAVQAGVAVPEADLPGLIAMVRYDDPPQMTVLGQLLSILNNSLAAENQVASTMLATTAELQEFIRWRMGLTKKEPALMTGWRGEILGQPLVELLEGRRFIRVEDIHSATPIHIARFEGE